MSSRIGIAAAAAAGLAAVSLLGGAPASAAPLHSGTVFGADCPGFGTVQVVGTPGNGHGRFTPGFVVGTHQLGVPYVLEFPGQPVEAKKAPLPADAVRCAILGPDGTTVVGYVTVAVHGKP
jgi:hypothetical protein